MGNLVPLSQGKTLCRCPMGNQVPLSRGKSWCRCPMGNPVPLSQGKTWCRCPMRNLVPLSPRENLVPLPDGKPGAIEFRGNLVPLPDKKPGAIESRENLVPLPDGKPGAIEPREILVPLPDGKPGAIESRENLVPLPDEKPGAIESRENVVPLPDKKPGAIEPRKSLVPLPDGKPGAIESRTSACRCTLGNTHARFLPGCNGGLSASGHACTPSAARGGVNMGANCTSARVGAVLNMRDFQRAPERLRESVLSALRCLSYASPLKTSVALSATRFGLLLLLGGLLGSAAWVCSTRAGSPGQAKRPGVLRGPAGAVRPAARAVFALPHHMARAATGWRAAQDGRVRASCRDMPHTTWTTNAMDITTLGINSSNNKAVHAGTRPLLESVAHRREAYTCAHRCDSRGNAPNTPHAAREAREAVHAALCVCGMCAPLFPGRSGFARGIGNGCDWVICRAPGPQCATAGACQGLKAGVVGCGCPKPTYHPNHPSGCSQEPRIWWLSEAAGLAAAQQQCCASRPRRGGRCMHTRLQPHRHAPALHCAQSTQKHPTQPLPRP